MRHDKEVTATNYSARKGAENFISLANGDYYRHFSTASLSPEKNLSNILPFIFSLKFPEENTRAHLFSLAIISSVLPWLVSCFLLLPDRTFQSFTAFQWTFLNCREFVDRGIFWL